MSAIADALEAAHEEILISDWWLSPEIYMKRPSVEGEKWRLDKILERKARDGIKIFVLLYKEVNLALGINSFYSKQKLVEKHKENIKVLRHPDHVSAGVLLWAHHEKLVIIDQSYAFVGGIDLCYGRWDDHKHRLTDLGSVSTQQKILQHKVTSSKPAVGMFMPSSILQLAKATNAVTIGTMVHTGAASDGQGNGQEPALPPEVEKSMEPVPDPTTVKFADSDSDTEITANGTEIPTGTTESESIAIQQEPVENGDAVPMKGETPPLRRKNLIRQMTKVTRELKDDGKEWMTKHLRRKHSKDGELSDTDESDKEKGDKDDKTEMKTVQSKSKSKRTVQIKHKPAVKTVSDGSVVGLQGLAKLWIGKDYTNFIVKDFVDLESPFTDMVDRSTTPRMPWHDIGVMVHGTAARDVARHFIQRWNAVKSEKVPLNPSYPYLLPKAYDFVNDTPPPILEEGVSSSRVSCQVLRSMTHWSGGIRITEDSIQQAYVESIENAKHYVYIENQFFVTQSVSNPQVQNRIGEALLQRILRAHREKTTFRVFVVMPLLPGFEGEVGTSRGIAIHAITHWNYSSICRGHNALMVRLMETGIDPTQYVTFHGLRTYSNLGDDMVTELIYVHSKLLIVDDNLVICGSANINDRSMTGKRDSEVCVILQDETFKDAVMDGAEYKAGRFAQSLRIHLFREHLGLMEDDQVDLRDPISEYFYREVWIKTATRNTQLYDEVFHCVPTDLVKSFRQMEEYQNSHTMALTNPTAARLMLKDVRGYLVNLPLEFLSEENLLPGANTREGLMPTQLWT
jgi:phospholipase D1/2